MKHTPIQMTPERALVKLEELCARAEHSTGEMRERLRKWSITGTESDRIIEKLKAGKFVDDARFAEAYVRDKVKFARWGRRKIAQGLYAKGIDRGLIKECLDHIDEEDYADNLRHLIAAKIKSTPTLIDTYEGRTKIYRFIISRGFEPALCAQALRDALTTRGSTGF